jgi:beta-glucanase (GH16 family)
MKYTAQLFLPIFLFIVNIIPAQNKFAYTVMDSVEGYHLIWHDEFDGNSLNVNNWKRLVGPYDYNNEVQYYTDRETNSYVENGKLIIKAINEHYVGAEGTREFTSARIISQNLADWKYGKIFVRAKLPKGIGTWPAIWLMPTESVYGNWPNSGEIDIMEHVGHVEDRIYGTIHTNAYNHRDGTQKGSNKYVPGATSEFHLYSIEWTEDFIEFSIDDNPYYKFYNEYKSWREWPFDRKFYMILNIGVGGGWGGQQGIDTSAFPVQMEIDYVRVYQKSANQNSDKYFVKHAGDNWAKHLMNDEGKDGDKIANDGIYSRKLNITATNNVKIDWVVADTVKDISPISWFYNPNPQDVLFTYNTNTYNDNFLPLTNIVNTYEDLGNNFTVIVKGVTDTIKYISEMTDNGDLANGDQIADDKIYSLHKKISSAGNYIWYVHHNVTSWAEGARWAKQGKISSWSDTASVEFTTTEENQDVYFYLDVKKGRVSTITDTVFVQPPQTKAYYFKSSSDGFIDHQMFDDGTNGDKTVNDGIYSLLYTVGETNSNILEWNVADSNKKIISIPSWFYNANGTKDILFTFDANKHRDIWSPVINICNSNEELPENFTVVIKNETAKLEFKNEMTDDGNLENGDTTASDKIFSLRKTINTPGTYTWYIKFNLDGAENIRWTQFGKMYSSSGLHSASFVTAEANQEVTFHLDLNTGRIASIVDVPDTKPVHKEYYAKHDGDGWANHLMRDDGLFGDKVANDGIYSALLTISKNKSGKNDWTVNDETNTQVGTISWFYNPEGTNDILFTIDTKVYNDGWLPKSNIKNTDEIKILNGPYGLMLDTTTYNNIMTDDGNINNGDTTYGDHIYSARLNVELPGKHKWFAYFGDFDSRRWDANGKQNGWEGAFPDTIDFETTVANQEVYFHLNINNGRLAVKSNETLVAVKINKEKLPDSFKLYQNYPNPFNPTTKIKYKIPVADANLASTTNNGIENNHLVQLKVYDILGREVTTLVDTEQPSGTYEVKFDASSLTSGIYFYELKIGGFTATKNMMLIK